MGERSWQDQPFPKGFGRFIFKQRSDDFDGVGASGEYIGAVLKKLLGRLTDELSQAGVAEAEYDAAYAAPK
ncbi:MAG TPA: hypothetical protein VFQ89_05625, partial [Candidatus Binatia bacterium]|nr:hypothetical protein [Candidatus Binatia bacterium]